MSVLDRLLRRLLYTLKSFLARAYCGRSYSTTGCRGCLEHDSRAGTAEDWTTAGEHEPNRPAASADGRVSTAGTGSESQSQISGRYTGVLSRISCQGCKQEHSKIESRLEILRF